LPYRLLIVLLLLVPSSGMLARSPTGLSSTQLAPEIASYQMNVRLDPATKTVSGTERISYINRSPDTLHEIWLRLYLRAFRDANTVWMREYGRWGDPLPQEYTGDITLNSLALEGGADLLASATLTDTLLRVPLPLALAPGQTLALDVAWVSKLPHVFMRTGYGGRDNTFFMVGQWYPKMAVYERGRWDTEPWHATAEFFNDFGSYDVSITAPGDYVLAGAGVPAGVSANSDGTRTLRFISDDVTDFAFAASPDFQVHTATSGAVTIALYSMPEHSAAVDMYLAVAAESLQLYGAWFGAYPHPRLTIVDVPDNAIAAGGMEYPTLLTSAVASAAYVTSHEIGHQWWPMQTATNEAAEPWLDEGLTEYTGIRYMAGSTYGWSGDRALSFERGMYALRAHTPATLPAWQYTSGSYVTVYAKTALGLWTLESIVGTDRFRQAMRNYLTQYRFKHPHAADFRAALEEPLGDLGWLFDDFLSGTGLMDYAAGPIVNTAAGSTIQILRKGDVRAPVDIRIALANGTRLLQTWDGQAASLDLSFPATNPIAYVEVDPSQKLKAELNRADNNAGTWQIQLPIVTR
jgi:hypothetical protein